jgi:CheY-like chemotaxis protein
MNILLVEDDVTLAQSVAEAIRARGWHVDVSHRGEPVAKSVLQDDYDALVLDIGLPGIDGLETLDQVRAQGSSLPVLMLTARDSIDDRVLGLANGADDYLVKPFAVPELLARLHALVRRHALRRSRVLQVASLRFDAALRRAYRRAGAQPDRARVDRGRIPAHAPGRHRGARPARRAGPGLDRRHLRQRDGAADVAPARQDRAGGRAAAVRGLGYLLEPAAPTDGVR